MIPANETFNGTWPFTPNFFEGNGFRQHYIDIAATTDTSKNVIVCVHGQPTWGYIYRNMIPKLSNLGRVIVPDHMGFGKSETPQERNYYIRDHVENFEALLLELDLQNITLVLQDWGGPIGTCFALRNPERIKAICLCNTYLPWSRVPEEQFKRPWVDWIKSEQFEPTVSNLGATILSVMIRLGLKRHNYTNDTWLEAYSKPFPTPEACRGALQFPRNIGSQETMSFFKEMAEKYDVTRLEKIPGMCIAGEEDSAMPTEWLKFRFKSFWKDGSIVTLPGVGHFCQEDAPETVTALIEQFIQVNDPDFIIPPTSGRAWNK